jgi:hypothetical protein
MAMSRLVPLLEFNQNPGLVAARDKAIVELRREKLQKETAEKPHKVARVRR